MTIYLHLNIVSKTNLDDTPINNGYIHYASDVDEWYLDRGDHRLKVVNIIPIENQATFDNLNDYTEQYLYIVMDGQHPMYIYQNDIIKQVYKLSEVEGIIFQDPNTLEPTIVTKNGVQYAPRTLLSAVYNQNGETIYKSVERLRMDMKNFQLSKNVTYEVYNNGERTLTIPYPTRFFDSGLDSLIILRNDNIVSPNDYKLTKTQVIFYYDLNKGDIITFIFNYGRIKPQNSVPDKSVGIGSLDDELYDFLQEPTEAINIILEDGRNLQEFLDEVDENMGAIGEYDDNTLNTVMGKMNNLLSRLTEVADNIETKASQSSVDAIKTAIDTNDANMISTLTEILEAVKIQDHSVVKSIQRGVGSMKAGSITTEITLDTGVNPDKCIVILTGDSYYNETPYVYTLEANQLTVSQKSVVYNEDYINKFSWQVLEFN